MTCRSYFLIHVVIHLMLQSHVRNLPPRLRPRSEEFRWRKASSGSADMGFPSNASKVRELIPENASFGRERRRLKPRSRTCKFSNLNFLMNGNCVRFVIQKTLNIDLIFQKIQYISIHFPSLASIKIARKPIVRLNSSCSQRRLYLQTCPNLVFARQIGTAHLKFNIC